MNRPTSKSLKPLLLAAALAVGTSGTLASTEASAWSLEEAAKPYAGTEVRGICDGYSPCLAYTEMAKKFEGSGHLPYTRTLIGAGPNGRTVIFEVIKKKPEYVERLQEMYDSTPHLVAREGEDCFVYHHQGRYYVIGSAKMSIKFIGSGHLPYTRTLTGGGPQGKTVAFEVDKKKPEYVERLMAQFQSKTM